MTIISKVWVLPFAERFDDESMNAKKLMKNCVFNFIAIFLLHGPIRYLKLYIQ